MDYALNLSHFHQEYQKNIDKPIMHIDHWRCFVINIDFVYIFGQHEFTTNSTYLNDVTFHIIQL